MTDQTQHPSLRRIMALDHADDAMRLLTDGLSGADLTTFLLEVARRRASGVRPSDVLSQYARDRFVTPAPVDPVRLAELHLEALRAAAPSFEAVAPAPLAPFGAHAALGDVHQNNVVTTFRPGEVAADPTTALALEAAVRRRVAAGGESSIAGVVRLAAVQRVLRAQVFDEARSFAHFVLFGLATAGRDTGNHDFETEALVGQFRVLIDLIDRVFACRVVIRLSDLGGAHGDVLGRVTDAVASDTVNCIVWPERLAGVGYYPNICFKLGVVVDDEEVEIADGGFVDWTQLLLENRKERLMISGLSLERMALIS